MKMTKTAANVKILNMAKKTSEAIRNEFEDILNSAEDVIKKNVPARFVKASLNKLEKMLDAEGISVQFDKTTSREALRKTAAIKVTAKEINETLSVVAKAIVAEAEDVLEDADDVANKFINQFASKHQYEVESKLKNVIESKLSGEIECKFSRVASK